MATPSAQIKLSGLARRLVQEGHLAELDAQRHYDAALKKKAPFVSYLVEHNLVRPADIAASASHEFYLWALSGHSSLMDLPHRLML